MLQASVPSACHFCGPRQRWGGQLPEIQCLLSARISCSVSRPVRRRRVVRQLLLLADAPALVAHAIQSNLSWSPSSSAGEDGQPSQDLRDLCGLQLGVLQTLLRSSSPNAQSLHAAVYLRVPGPECPSGAVLLQRVAATPRAVPGVRPQSSLSQEGSKSQQEDRSTAQSEGSFGADVGINKFSGNQDCIVLQLGGDVSHSIPGSMPPESCLVTEEVLVLPNSGALVLPLVDGPSLVGLLLVEPATPRVTLSPQLDTQGMGRSGRFMEEDVMDASSMGSSGMQLGSSSLSDIMSGSEESAVAMPVTTLATTSMHKPGAVTTEVHQPIADGHFITPGPSGIPTTLVTHYPGFTDEEIHALRAVAPLLAKACAMELRAALKTAASVAKQAAAARLLREASRPASALNTFSAMLLPRMEQGSADRDLVSGIASQGKRLQELLRQLDAALAPPLPRLMRPNLPSLGGSTPSSPQARLSMQPKQPTLQPSQRVVPATAGVAQRMLPTKTYHEQSSQPVPASAQQKRHQDALPEHSSSQQIASTGSSLSNNYHHSTPSLATSSEEQATWTASTGSVTSVLPLSSSPNTFTSTPANTITPPALIASASIPESVQLLDVQEGPDSMLLEPRTFTMRLASESCMSMDGVIDMECEAEDDGTLSVQGPLRSQPAGPISSRPGRSSTTTSTSQSQALQRPYPIPSTSSAPGPAAVRRRSVDGITGPATHATDIVPTLIPILTAAAKLAKVTDIEFIVQPPLQAAVPSTATKPVLGHQLPGVARRDEVPALKPRPNRPVMVATTPHMLQRIMAYLIDLVLQCTPRGGMVKVSMRSGMQTGGVELIVSHIGRTSASKIPQGVMHHAASGPLRTVAGGRQQHMQPIGALGQEGVQGVMHGVVGVAMLERPVEVPVATSSGVPLSNTTGLALGGGLLSFAMAEELVTRVGGRVSYEPEGAAQHAEQGMMVPGGMRVVIHLPGA